VEGLELERSIDRDSSSPVTERQKNTGTLDEFKESRCDVLFRS
jgi:hypothetical protein